MAIPSYQELMLPLLKLVFNKKEATLKDAVEYLSEEFKLTLEEKNKILPSGQMTYFKNKIGWAATYLKKAGLIFYPHKRCYSITEEGKNVLLKNPEQIDNKFLMQYDSFKEFKSRKKDLIKKPVQEEISVEMTPEEALEYGFEKINESLADDLISTVLEKEDKFFEQLVVDLLVKMGYGGSLQEAGEVVGKSGDGGIDGVIKEDKLGLDKIYIQAKRWSEGSVGRPELQKFIGALSGQGASKGIFITSSKFSQGAIDYIQQNKQFNVVLIDGERLAELMIEYNIGVSVVNTYEVKKIDSDYFNEL